MYMKVTVGTLGGFEGPGSPREAQGDPREAQGGPRVVLGGSVLSFSSIVCRLEVLYGTIFGLKHHMINM